MKYTLYIDKSSDEEITIVAHEKTPLIEKIEALINSENRENTIWGYRGEEIIAVNHEDVYCFIIEDKRLYALLDKEKYLIKMRLYELEGILPNSFVKINQSAIANLKKIERFRATIGTGLEVHFKNGHRDYVSRRQIKVLKERLEIK